jgi:mRNA-degrading endonuclease toxin of MazEF toxin-antitoxin module
VARILRGEIYWADLNPAEVPTSRMRPVVILSQDVFNQRLGR